MSFQLGGGRMEERLDGNGETKYVCEYITYFYFYGPPLYLYL